MIFRTKNLSNCLDDLGYALSNVDMAAKDLKIDILRHTNGEIEADFLSQMEEILEICEDMDFRKFRQLCKKIDKLERAIKKFEKKNVVPPTPGVKENERT